MSKRIVTCTAAIAATLILSNAMADPWKHKHHAKHRSYAEADYDYAQVTHVEPIVRRVRVDRPVRECWEETRVEEPRYRGGADTGARTLLGGIIGGVIGHQIGDGRGKDVATAAGAVIGSAIGHRSAVRRDARYAYEEPREYTVERCDVQHEAAYEERIEGYEVEYRYNGRTYHTRMPYDPGERVRVRVAVSPTYVN